jgi:hypothetical protein
LLCFYLVQIWLHVALRLQAFVHAASLAQPQGLIWMTTDCYLAVVGCHAIYVTVRPSLLVQYVNTNETVTSNVQMLDFGGISGIAAVPAALRIWSCNIHRLPVVGSHVWVGPALCCMCVPALAV